MLKKVSLIFLLAIVCAVSASAQTVDEIISKNLTARGGLDKIKAVKSIKTSGKILMQGMELPIVVQVKRPNAIRMEMSFQGKSIVQAFDGSTGWSIMPFAGSSDPQKMSEEEVSQMKDDADIDGPLVDYKEKGYSVELIGKEDLEGSPAFKLKVTKKSGDVSYIYIDAESYLEVKSTSKRKIQGNEMEIETYTSDYKSVGGLMFPYTIEQKVRGNTMTQSVLEKVELDAPMEDTIFRMPSSK